MPAIAERRIQPEILDALPAHDPRAARCRRDLRLINWLMGNERWILRILRQHRARLAGGVVELGAGNGDLLKKLRRIFPDTRLTGFDLAARPTDLPVSIGWHTGDVLTTTEPWDGVLVANLFLHHLSAQHLAVVGSRLHGVKLLVIGEGHRSPTVARRSRWLRPLLGPETCHDMEVSLAAGFLAGELPAALGLSEDRWRIEEHSASFGALRVIAIRR